MVGRACMGAGGVNDWHLGEVGGLIRACEVEPDVCGYLPAFAGWCGMLNGANNHGTGSRGWGFASMGRVGRGAAHGVP